MRWPDTGLWPGFIKIAHRNRIDRIPSEEAEGKLPFNGTGSE
ncbi:hypothetical protein THTE_2954 [Thermogutta terrifontis]|uniref:Uncharacterized protein n=1 Tax=Thermogutta terrifontis TaxID=1331910 RepID=A0A286RHZ7_9BACT|nr:hypothetical protein THTE_2954 [Thermogutta terrifontis]